MAPLPLNPLTLLQRARASRNDPYWDDFLHRPPQDPRNLVATAFVGAAEDAVNPVRSEVHSPNIMASHIKELGRFWGADEVAILRLVPPAAAAGAAAPHDEPRAPSPSSSPSPPPPPPPFAVVCALRADEDPRVAPGPGGQTPAMKGLFATFCLAAYIRELGFPAYRVQDSPREALAVAAGLGQSRPYGRLVSRRLGCPLYVAEIIQTDLPLQEDGVVELAGDEP